MPDGILTKSQMVDVISDMQLMEAAHRSLTLSSKIQNPMRDTSYTIVFNKHHTDVATFDSSLHVYTKHPKLFSEIMDEVEVKLNSSQ